MLRVGLTGGVGSGKSTVSELFARHGVNIIDADQIVREMVARGGPAYAEVVQAFGPQVLNADREIDRPRLRSLIFEHPDKRRRLEGILHPRVRVEIQTRTRNSPGPYCIIVIPLLIEANMQDLVDRILVVDAHEDLQISRVAMRGWNKRQIEQALATQTDRAERRRQAHDVIENNGDLAQLTRKVEELHRSYLSLAAQKPTKA